MRGFRIELGEIESALLKNEHIKEAIVVQKQQMNTEKFLCAYIVADGEMNIPDLRVELASHIPTYMVPSYFMQLEKMPLNPSGKIDLKALPEPAAGDSGEQYVEARDDVEEVLVKVFSKVLGVKKIGINDNFFVLGGDSIKAVQISAKLLQEGLKLEINDLFKNPTISQLRNYIKQTKKRVEQGVVEGPVKLPPIAKWFFEHIKTDRHHWNHALMVFRAQGFSEELIKRVFTRIIEHHDALRLVVSVHNEEIALYNQGVAETSLDLHVFHLTDLAEPELSKTITEKANSLQASFDLNQGPLVKLGLFKTASGDHLLMVFHHLVIDGVSWRILFEDFEIAYRQAEKGENIALPPKSTSYKEWVEKIYQ